MKSLRLAVIDDDSQTRRIIIDSLKDIFKTDQFEVEITPFEDAKSYYKVFHSRNDNLIFLDIEMDEMDGIELAKKLKEEQCHSDIVFVSNREDRVFDSLKTSPFGFVRKSHFRSDVSTVIQNFLKGLKEDAENILLINLGKNQITLPLSEITFIETVKRKTVIHILGKEPLSCPVQFKTIEEALKNKGFLLSYKGVLVNFHHIEAILEDSILLKDKTMVPLSRRNSIEVKEKFMYLMQDRLIQIY